MTNIITQRSNIRKALLNGERITRIEAQNNYGVSRLAARIYELQKEMDIKKGWRIVPTRIGISTRIREYWV